MSDNKALEADDVDLLVLANTESQTPHELDKETGEMSSSSSTLPIGPPSPTTSFKQEVGAETSEEAHARKPEEGSPKGGADATKSGAVTVDTLLDELGSPGCGQIFVYLLLCLNVFPVSLNFMAMSFFGAKPNQTCHLPDGWPMNESIPRNKDGTYENCEMYRDPNDTGRGLQECVYGYDYHLSGGRFPIAAEWDLVCDYEYQVRLAQSLFFLGVMIGGLMFGFLGDHFGRRPITLVTLYTQAVLGAAVAFSSHYAMFVVLKFFQGMMLQGLQTSSTTMAMELYQTQYRTKAGMGVAMLATACSMVIGLISFLLPHWRHMQLAISIPTVITISFLWLLPESLRWLLTNQKRDEALQVARRYTKLNRIALPPDAAHHMEMISEQIAKNNTQNFKGNVYDLLKMPTVRRTSIILFYGWFSASVVYYGITFSIPNLSGNVSLNFFIVGALETTARFIGYFIIKRFGRRIPLSVCFVLSGILCTVSGCINRAFEDQNIPSLKTFTTIMALFGRACMGQCFAFILIVTSEVFPTVLRTVSSGACSFWSRVGGTIAPFTLLLDSYVGKATPFIVFGGLAIVAGGLSLLIPETLNVPLPDTVRDLKGVHGTQDATPPAERSTKEGRDNHALDKERAAAE